MRRPGRWSTSPSSSRPNRFVWGEFEEDYDNTFAADEQSDRFEFSELVAVCQGFNACAARLVPKLRAHDLTQPQAEATGHQVEKIRATADWIESAVATGKFDLDEQFAQLLRDQ
ncbi:DUF6192 family protein [Streptomyces chartreusis]|uniref:DUF6192 family protein n=1 Tax=Streptomyces chartreusis TaxID=1969 RepID=UPI0036937D34